MAINPNDMWYRREETPPTIKAAGAALCVAYGVGADHFGAKGNLTHYSGYHRSRDYILNSPYSPYKASDYSVVQTPDKGGDARDVSAFDFTPAVWGSADNRSKMVVLTKRLLTAAQARDPRVANLREFAGTLDGRTVVTFDLMRMSFKEPFDSTHLDHIHGSLWRSRAASDHSGIVSVMLGGNMAAGDADKYAEAAAWREHAFTYGLDEVPNSEKWSGTGKREKHWGVLTLKALLSKAGMTEEELAEIKAAAAAGAAEGSAGASVDEVRKVFDEELDEAFRGGADEDPPPPPPT
jgi:hypothetical protein